MSDHDPMDSFLRDAISAARDRAADGADDGAATRLRIRESLAARPGARKRFTLITAVIATMFGSTAFAYVAAVNAGWTPPWRSPALTETNAPRPSVALPERPAVPLDASPIAAIRVEEVAVPATLPALVEAPRAPVPPPPRRVARPTLSTPAPIPDLPPTAIVVEAPKPAEVVTAPSSELAAYRRAHELHFRGADPAAALVAWDAYLTGYPRGSLAPEARYDRALLLVKLGRYADARAALAPFASATSGTYRQREAAEILRAIQGR